MNAPRALPDLIQAAVARRPRRPAVVFGERSRSYAELAAAGDRLAAALATRGVRRGDRVALLMHNGFEFVEAMLGIHRTGAAAVPINFRLVADEVAYVLADCGATVAIAGPELLGHAGFESLDSVLAGAPPEPPPRPALGGEDLAFLMYTSGTTGRPKGAMLTHANLLASTASWIEEIGAGAEDVWMSGQPLFHIGGLNGLLPFLSLGATSVLCPTTGFDATAAVDGLLTHRVTRCVFVPTQWSEICAQPRAGELAASPIRTAIWGGSAAPRATVERLQATLPRAEIVNAYGQTEMSGTTTMLKGEPLRRPGSVGRPIRGVETRIVGADGGEVRQGEVGELLYRGPFVMRGYHGRPEATAAAMAGGWFHSGDLLREDEAGFLYVVDRKKDMIVSGGENVYPAEVERAIGSHPGVADVAVVGIEHPRWMETPLAVVVPERGAELSEAELLAHCRERLAGYKKPSAVRFAESLPRNAAGKVLKAELRERHADACLN